MAAVSRILGGITPDGVQKMRRIPRGRLFEFAAAFGIDPLEARPDLAEWIEAERARRASADAALPELGQAVERRWDAPAIEAGLVDLWTALAAILFVSRQRDILVQLVYRGKGRQSEAARAYAMALAKVVGRASSTHIAGVFRCSRQNVDNAAERYLRARDGDDPEDYIKGQFPDQIPRVWEVGTNRLRPAKVAQDGLWEEERQFEALLTGQDLTLPKAVRRRA